MTRLNLILGISVLALAAVYQFGRQHESNARDAAAARDRAAAARDHMEARDDAQAAKDALPDNDAGIVRWLLSIAD